MTSTARNIVIRADYNGFINTLATKRYVFDGELRIFVNGVEWRSTK
jgi:hypothetical protein